MSMYAEEQGTSKHKANNAIVSHCVDAYIEKEDRNQGGDQPQPEKPGNERNVYWAI